MKNYIPMFEEFSEGIGLSFESLMRYVPSDLVDIIVDLDDVEQDPEWHPEGSVLRHIKSVVNRLAKYGDINLSIAGLLHDEGKSRTTYVNPKTNRLTSPSHEKYSLEVVDIFRDWIIEMGGDPEVVKFIIANHMRIKFPDNMSAVEKKHIEADPSYDLLLKFSEADKGGVYESFKINETIVHRDGKYYVYSKKKDSSGKRKKLGGPYTSRTAAEKRLGQIEFYKTHG